METIFSVLSSIHIVGAKYSIYSRKTENSTNITIHNITERIESHKILEVTDDEGEIHLLINIKYKLIVVEPGFPFKNTSHSTGLVFYKTNTRDPQ